YVQWEGGPESSSQARRSALSRFIRASGHANGNRPGEIMVRGPWAPTDRPERQFLVAVRTKFHSGQTKLHTGHSKLHWAGCAALWPLGLPGRGEGPGAKGRGGGAVKYDVVDRLSCFHEKKYLNSSSASALRSFATSCSNSAMASARPRKPPLNYRSQNAGSISFFTVTSKRWATVRSCNGRPASPEARDVRLGPRPSKTWSYGCSRLNRRALIAWSPR